MSARDEGAASSEERSPREQAIEELDWYYGKADAAMKWRGIDYASLAGGVARVHDDAAHDALILAPLDMAFREGLWRRAWVETALFRISLRQEMVLSLAFTPRRWQMPVEARLGEQLASLSCKRLVDKTIDEKGRSHATVEIEDSEVGARASREDKPKNVKVGINLLSLALDTGVVRQVYDAHPATVAMQAHEPFEVNRAHLLAFLQQMAEHTYVEHNLKVSRAGTATLRAIRDGAEATLAPALDAYEAAGAERDPRLAPHKLHASESRRKSDERYRERCIRSRDRAAARVKQLQGYTRG